MIWSFGGTALTTYGKVTLINDYLDIPERRGENQLIPFRHGKIFVPKYYDERKMVFGIAIQAASALALESTIDALKAKIAPRTEQTLSNIREDGTIRTVPASVETPMQIERYGSNKALLTIEFSLAFPLFRLSTAITDNTTTINANPKAMTVTNPGTIEERDATIIMTGPLSNTVMTNSINGCILTYTGTIASPRVVTIQTVNGEYVATTDLGVSVIGNITHAGAAALMVFDVGSNPLSIADGTHTTGTVKVSFNAPYL
jgi:tail protein